MPGRGHGPSIVAARDPLGNEVVERIEVVGLYDYRGLPWAAIVGVPPPSAPVPCSSCGSRVDGPRTCRALGDGRLEELDPIDGATLHGPREPRCNCYA